MSDIIKKGFLLGLGAAISGKEKLEKKLDELVDRNEISQDEAKEMMNNFIEKGEMKTGEWSAKQMEQSKKKAEDLGLATKDDIAALQERITELEIKLINKDQ
jgi:polyhydroxyalkanoate synthesis regulator phasin